MYERASEPCAAGYHVFAPDYFRGETAEGKDDMMGRGGLEMIDRCPLSVQLSTFQWWIT